MLFFRAMITICLAFSVPACAIRPVPEESTGFSTYLIVRKIRCEMREAIEYYAIKAVKRRDSLLGNQLAEGLVKFADINREKMEPGLRRVINRYDGAAIAYDFVFDITERNDTTAGLGLKWPFTQGPVSLGLSGGNERARENSRNFRIVDKFDRLITSVRPEFCDQSLTGENFAYPITGSIGLRELVGTFLDLNQSGNLGGVDGVPTISDIIQFTTKISAGVKPGVAYSTSGKVLQLSNISGSLDVSRQDVHKVTIAISLPPENQQSVKFDLGSIAGSRVGLTIAEQRALNEVFYQQRRFLFDKLTRSTAAGAVLVD